MKAYKAIAFFLLCILLSSCKNPNSFFSKGFEIKLSNDSMLTVKNDTYKVAFVPPIEGNRDANAFFVYLEDSTSALFFDVKKDSRQWDFALTKNNKLEGKLLSFDEYGAVKSISWYHDGEEFLALTSSGGVIYFNDGNLKANRIKKPFFKVSKELPKWHFIIEQNTCPTVFGSVSNGHNKIQNYKNDLISNTIEFDIEPDSFPLILKVEYGLNVNQVFKSYQWSSATDSLTEVQVKQLPVPHDSQ